MSIRFDPGARGHREPRKQISNNRSVARLGSVVAVRMADGSVGLGLTVSGALIKCFGAEAAVQLADALIDGIECIESQQAGRHRPAATTTTHDKETA